MFSLHFSFLDWYCTRVSMLSHQQRRAASGHHPAWQVRLPRPLIMNWARKCRFPSQWPHHRTLPHHRAWTHRPTTHPVTRVRWVPNCTHKTTELFGVVLVEFLHVCRCPFPLFPRFPLGPYFVGVVVVWMPVYICMSSPVNQINKHGLNRISIGMFTCISHHGFATSASDVHSSRFLRRAIKISFTSLSKGSKSTYNDDVDVDVRTPPKTESI